MSKMIKRISSFISKYFSGKPLKQPVKESVKESDSSKSEPIFLLTKSEMIQMLRFITDEDRTKEEKLPEVRSLILNGHYRQAKGVRVLY